MDSLSIGIRADDVERSQIILREGNYRVWSTFLEQTLRESVGNMWFQETHMKDWVDSNVGRQPQAIS